MSPSPLTAFITPRTFLKIDIVTERVTLFSFNMGLAVTKIGVLSFFCVDLFSVPLFCHPFLSFDFFLLLVVVVAVELLRLIFFMFASFFFLLLCQSFIARILVYSRV